MIFQGSDLLGAGAAAHYQAPEVSSLINEQLDCFKKIFKTLAFRKSGYYADDGALCREVEFLEQLLIFFARHKLAEVDGGADGGDLLRLKAGLDHDLPDMFRDGDDAAGKGAIQIATERPALERHMIVLGSNQRRDAGYFPGNGAQEVVRVAVGIDQVNLLAP